jgi:hypothetical protein
LQVFDLQVFAEDDKVKSLHRSGDFALFCPLLQGSGKLSESAALRPMQNCVRRFSGFPAGSLPRLRFLPGGVLKSMIAHVFHRGGSFQKKIYPRFSRAAG